MVGAIDALLEILAARVVSFVHHQEVPTLRGQNLRAAVSSFGELAACQQDIKRVPRVFSRGRHLLPARIPESPGVVARDVQGKLFVHLFLPLLEH